MQRLMSVEQAAERLGGISKWTVHAWLSKGTPDEGRQQDNDPRERSAGVH
jgi:hypothetical protein